MLQTKPTGLTAAEVAERAARGEVNRVRRPGAAEYADIAARNLLTLFNAIVVPAAAALFSLGEYRGALGVSGFAVTNTLLGLVQEVRAKRHLDRLALLAETRVRVVRDGAGAEVPSGDVVRGDLVELAAGEPVVADGEVVEARFLEVDEALLTGESDPVPRRAGDRLLSGSFAVAGEGRYVADRVGAESFAQRTAAVARRYRFTAGPLQAHIDRLIRALTCVTVVLCLLYGILYSRRDLSETQLVQMVAATVTSLIPQGLVLMATLALVLGAVRLSARGALVQRLDAVESMAEVDTLCMDKTGTLTTNRLRLEEVRVLAPGLDDEAVRDRLRLFASASLDRTNKSLAALRAALGEAPAELLDQLPFKSQNRYSAVRVRDGRGEHVLALGAAEALQPFLHDAALVAEADRRELARAGLRLLLFAEAAGPADGSPFNGSLDGFALRPLALVALSDELRPDAGEVLRLLAGQGIDFKILSGDNPETVRATVRPLVAGATEPALRALADAPVVTGAELEAAADPDRLTRERIVFGRVSPWQKVQIVKALKADGRRVAMVGDGVNDVLPIKQAHLGVAMGEGSRAAKTVAGLVLQTNSFALLPATLEEGRTVLRNLRLAGKLFLAKNVSVLLMIVLGVWLFALPFPLLPQQTPLLNFLTIGIPALLIISDRGRAAAGTDFVREIGSFVVRTGLVVGAAGFTVQFLAARWWEEDARAQRTLLLTALVLLGLTTLLRALDDGEARRRKGAGKYRLYAAAALAAYLAALYWPSAADFFQLVPLGPAQWGRVLAVAGPAYGLALASDLVARRRGW
jgi:cation-transporting ATPase E